MSEIESPLNELFELLVTILITEPKTIAKLLKISVVFKKTFALLTASEKVVSRSKGNDFALGK